MSAAGYAEIRENGDLFIPADEVTETARFYPVTVEGTDMEILAVRAPDGSIRTAFNTCQVCYASGRGYYVQDGGYLICQNCGNRFSMGDVEVTRGGCNPVPITKQYKSADDLGVTVPYDFLKRAKVIFASWKVRSY
ncbi:MAG: DUF2318 domain-containing protein [Synergistaceae bacterium]|nr:DUF2318 domain-containing protein [Synergistaceae bacterium]